VAAPPAPVVAAEALTRDGEARLRAELDELTRVKRPQVIARIRTAKEHGDLKENSEYHAARESSRSSRAGPGDRGATCARRSSSKRRSPAHASGSVRVVTVDDDGETIAYTIVGADESDPPRGRISSSSPVGRALVGRDTGDYVVVVTPAGERRYRILGIA
jgi:transcription elongation factor GreA